MIETISMEDMQKLRDGNNHCASIFFDSEMMKQISKYEWDIPRKEITTLGNIKFCCTKASGSKSGKTFWFTAETRKQNVATLNAMITLKNKYRIEKKDLIPDNPFGYGIPGGMNGQAASCPAFTSK